MTTQPGQPETVAGAMARLTEAIQPGTVTRQLVNHAVAYHRCFERGFPGDASVLAAALAAARAEAFAEIRRGMEAGHKPSASAFSGTYRLGWEAGVASVMALLPSVPPE